MGWPLLKKLLPGVLAVGAILVLSWFLYDYGYKQGSRDVKLEWKADQQKAQAAYNQLVKELAKREAAHQAESARITDELSKARQDHEVALADQRATYEHRLLQSAHRGEVYRRQAEAGAAECRDLAGHAARLDRTLEEGRGLVRELADTLGFRERQLVQLGQQILNDRRLCAGGADE